MDKIIDFFREVGERFKSPFFASFIISWLGVNWRIPLLIFTNDNKLGADGMYIFEKYVLDNSSISNFLFIPLALAVAFTIAFPVIRVWNSAFRAFIDKWGSNWIFKISKDGKVEMETYLTLRNNYRSKEKELEEVLKNESVHFQAKLNLESQLSAVGIELNKKNDLLFKYDRMHDFSLLTGNWDFTVKRIHYKAQGGIQTVTPDAEPQINITNGMISKFSSDTAFPPFARMENYYFNEGEKTITFIKAYYPLNPATESVNIFDVVAGADKLVGYEFFKDGQYNQITMKRISS
jgi:hypothetical protein